MPGRARRSVGHGALGPVAGRKHGTALDDGCKNMTPNNNNNDDDDDDDDNNNNNRTS
jgi:hypothetical protein